MLAIAATAVPPSQRGRWLKQIANSSTAIEHGSRTPAASREVAMAAFATSWSGGGNSKIGRSASLIGHSGSSAFQTIHHYSVDVAHGLVLLFGIGTTALPSWGSRIRWNNLYRGLAVR